MTTPTTTLQPPIAPAVVALADTIQSRGHRSWLVGETLHLLARGDAVTHFQLVTDAPMDRILEILPSAVPTRARDRLVSVPTRAGPVDIAELRHGSSVETDLAHRDFTVNAMALPLPSGELIDPFDAREDMAEGRLRAVGIAIDRLREEPLRALRAASHLALFGYRPDRELEAALSSESWGIAAHSAAPVRGELLRLLSGPWAGPAIALLRRTSLEHPLVPNPNPHAPEMMNHLPNDRLLRLVAWLPPSGGSAVLARWRFDPQLSRLALRMLDHHPVDERVRANVDHSVIRLRGRFDDAELQKLFCLREAELEAIEERDGPDDPALAPAREGLEAVRRAIERVDHIANRRALRASLALDGGQVMAELGCGPGREIGAALRYLAKRVEDDASCNTREGLLAHLRHWMRVQAEQKLPPNAAGSETR